MVLPQLPKYGKLDTDDPERWNFAFSTKFNRSHVKYFGIVSTNFIKYFLMKMYPKKLFLPPLPKYGNLLLYTAKIEFFYFSFSKSKDWITNFQGPAQYLSEKIFCQDILKNVCFASNAQIWKFGPRHDKTWNFWNSFQKMKRSSH